MGDKLTAISLFSGCGGFDWGVKQSGVEIIWANDIDQHAAAAYRSIFPDVEFIHNDIQNISRFPKADILIGCFPCTGYSIAARRRWGNSTVRDLKNDSTNFLYWQFLRVLEQIKPKFAFIENVGGMISADAGYFLEEQKFHFRRLRYEAVYSHLLASDFGAAQARERVFIVLTSYDVRPFKYQFPKPTHGSKGTQPANVLRDVIGGMDEWPKGEFSENPFHGHYLTRNRKRGWDELSYTIVAHADHVPLHPMGEAMRSVGKDAWELQGDVNRRLSWREGAAIQGLPSNVSPSGNLSQKYRVIGNAVPPVFGEALVKPIITSSPASTILRF